MAVRQYLNSYLLLLVVNALNLVASGLIIAICIVNIVDGAPPTNVVIYNAYSACLFLALLAAEFRPPAFVADSTKFLLTYRGRGLLYTFFGCLVYTNTIFNIAACIFIETLGVTLFVLSWVNLVPPRYGLLYNWGQWTQLANPRLGRDSPANNFSPGSVAGDHKPAIMTDYQTARIRMGYLTGGGGSHLSPHPLASLASSSSSPSLSSSPDTAPPPPRYHYTVNTPTGPGYRVDATTSNIRRSKTTCDAPFRYSPYICTATPVRSASPRLHDHQYSGIPYCNNPSPLDPATPTILVSAATSTNPHMNAAEHPCAPPPSSGSPALSPYPAAINNTNNNATAGGTSSLMDKLEDITKTLDNDNFESKSAAITPTPSSKSSFRHSNPLSPTSRLSSDATPSSLISLSTTVAPVRRKSTTIRFA
ncbi:hypothetical protein EV182_002635 [Spiromyces aspiralis]|uniref:Uncharacterized protein n=1 Tax=Spiromyces aspiralis TaxID=68401 RepID=A0ACC1HE58_9FUNG|nr:hypothetical protein EV182_002635 [Spiromyces aspiralis]